MCLPPKGGHLLISLMVALCSGVHGWPISAFLCEQEERAGFRLCSQNLGYLARPVMELPNRALPGVKSLPSWKSKCDNMGPVPMSPTQHRGCTLTTPDKGECYYWLKGSGSIYGLSMTHFHGQPRTGGNPMIMMLLSTIPQLVNSSTWVCTSCH